MSAHHDAELTVGSLRMAAATLGAPSTGDLYSDMGMPGDRRTEWEADEDVEPGFEQAAVSLLLDPEAVAVDDGQSLDALSKQDREPQN